MHKDVYNDIKKILILYDKSTTCGGMHITETDIFQPTYGFTTENIRDYYKELEFSDKKVLATCSSGDHILNAILEGASVVDCFDINGFTKYYMELKRAAILALKYNEFLEKFVRKIVDKDFIDLDCYKVIREHLSDDSLIFWNELYNKRVPLNMLINNVYTNEQIIKKSNNYMNRSNYNKLQGRLDNLHINFIESNLLDLPNSDQVKNKYDIILLSNIVQQLRMTYSQYRRFILEDLSTIVNNSGDIVIAYLYGYDVPDDGIKTLKNAFGDLLKVHDFNSYWDGNKGTDAVYVYKKLK